MPLILYSMGLENGRTKDAAYQFHGQEYIVFDLTRSSMEVLNYDIMERLKNGKVSSTKYEPVKKVLQIY
jgi:hypothetical protein